MMLETLWQGQGYLPLVQIAWNLIQSGLEHVQGWGIHNFFGQSVPLPSE